MKKLESLRKKELIELITEIRPKADAYDRVCKVLGIKNNIIGFVKKITLTRVHVNTVSVCSLNRKPFHCDLHTRFVYGCYGCDYVK